MSTKMGEYHIQSKAKELNVIRFKTSSGKSLKLPIKYFKQPGEYKTTYSENEKSEYENKNYDKVRFFRILTLLKAGVKGEIPNLNLSPKLIRENANTEMPKIEYGKQIKEFFKELTFKDYIYGLSKFIQVIFSIVNFLFGYIFMRLDHHLLASFYYNLAGLFSFPISINYVKEKLNITNNKLSNILTAISMIVAIGLCALGGQSLPDIKEEIMKEEQEKLKDTKVNTKDSIPVKLNNQISDEDLNTLYEIVKEKQDSIKSASSTITKP